MKTYKTFEYMDFPEPLREILKDKFCFGKYHYLIYYPGEGYFKPLEEVRDTNNILRWGNEKCYVYEIGDDLITDWLMSQGAELCEDILILIDW